MSWFSVPLVASLDSLFFFIFPSRRWIERQGKVPYSDLVTRLWRALVSRHRGWHRVPAASRRRLAPMSNLQPASLQHHRGDYRTQIQQVCLAAQFGNFRMRFVPCNLFSIFLNQTICLFPIILSFILEKLPSASEPVRKEMWRAILKTSLFCRYFLYILFV